MEKIFIVRLVSNTKFYFSDVDKALKCAQMYSA